MIFIHMYLMSNNKGINYHSKLLIVIFFIPTVNKNLPFVHLFKQLATRYFLFQISPKIVISHHLNTKRKMLIKNNK